MKKAALRKLVVKRLSTREIAVELGCSQTNIRYWLKKFGLKTRKKIPKCIYCGETKADKLMKNGNKGLASRCKACHARKTIERGRRNKAKFIEYLGGKCVACGYADCPDALDFHHVSRDKDPSWKSIKLWSFGRAKVELDKCVLLCARCHREVHAGFRTVSGA
jgi:Zn ribbon nucleic-acid-binding protein